MSDFAAFAVFGFAPLAFAWALTALTIPKEYR